MQVSKEVSRDSIETQRGAESSEEDYSGKLSTPENSTPESSTPEKNITDVSQPEISQDSFENKDSKDSTSNKENKSETDKDDYGDQQESVETCSVEKACEIQEVAEKNVEVDLADDKQPDNYCVPNMQQIRQEYNKIRKNTHYLKMNSKQLEEDLDYFLEHQEFKKYPVEKNSQDDASINPTQNSNEPDAKSISSHCSKESCSLKSSVSTHKQTEQRCLSRRSSSACDYSKTSRSYYKSMDCSGSDSISHKSSLSKQQSHSKHRKNNSKYNSVEKHQKYKRDERKLRRSVYEEKPRRSRAYVSYSSEHSTCSSSVSRSVPRQANFDRRAKFAIDKPAGYQKDFGVKRKKNSRNQDECENNKSSESEDDGGRSLKQLDDDEHSGLIENEEESGDEFGGHFDKYGHYYCDKGGFTTDEGGYYDGKGGYYHYDGGFTDKNGIYYEYKKRPKKNRSKNRGSYSSLQQRQDSRGYSVPSNHLSGNFESVNPYCFYHHYQVGAPPPCMCVPRIGGKYPGPARSERRRPASREVPSNSSRWSSADDSADGASIAPSKSSDRMVHHSVRKPRQYDNQSEFYKKRINIYEDTESSGEESVEDLDIPSYELTGREYPLSKGISTANEFFSKNILDEQSVDPVKKAFKGVYEKVVDETRKRVEHMFSKNKK